MKNNKDKELLENWEEKLDLFDNMIMTMGDLVNASSRSFGGFTNLRDFIPKLLSAKERQVREEVGEDLLEARSIGESRMYYWERGFGSIKELDYKWYELEQKYLN